MGLVSAFQHVTGRISKALTGSLFRRNTFLLVRASVVTQALLLLATPILTRLFTPKDFGAAGLFVLASSMVGAFASLRFEWSIPSARSDEDARSLAVLSLILVGGVALFLLFVFLVPDQAVLFGFFGLQPIAFAPLIPIFALASSTISVLSAVCVRQREMGPVSQAKYVQSGSQLLGNLTMGFSGMASLGMILSYMIGAITATLVLLHNVRSRLSLDLALSFRMFDTGRRYLAQASASTIVSVVNFTFGNCLPLLLLFAYSVEEVGFYFVAMRLAGTPAVLISSGISSSFWGEAAELAKRDPLALRRKYLKVVATLARVSVLVAAGCLAAPYFLPIVLGADNWGHVGIVVAVCLPQIAATLIFSSTNHLIVYNRQVYQLISDIISIFGSVASIWVAKVLGWPFWAAILAMSSVILLSYLLRFALHLRANSEVVRAHAKL